MPAGWRKRVQESIKDFSPDTKDSVLKIIDSWQDTESEEKLKQLLGDDKAESLIKKISRTTKTKNEAALTSEQQNQVKDMFRESLTFD